MSELIKGLLFLAVLLTQTACGPKARVDMADVDCETFLQNWLSDCGYANCAWGENNGAYVMTRWECEVGNEVTVSPVNGQCLMSQTTVFRDWSNFEAQFGSASDGTCTLADWKSEDLN